MGTGSFIWEGFVDPDTKIAVYSVELARPQISGGSWIYRDTPQVKSNVTFGSANDEAYIGHECVLMTSLANYSYGVDNFAFGIVYQADNGTDESEYFYELGNSYPVQFSTNFKGLGLPAYLYS